MMPSSERWQLVSEKGWDEKMEGLRAEMEPGGRNLIVLGRLCLSRPEKGGLSVRVCP